MTAGIEKINLYAGRYKTDAVALAVARGRDESYVKDQVMVLERSVIPAYEDSVTLAVNAAKPMLEGVDRSEIGLLIVATESGVDFGKPNASWVHRYCDLPPNCRLFDCKHACYGATAALKMALTWVLSSASNGKKALLVSADYSRGGLVMKHGYDFVGGGSAVAMLLSRNAAILEIEPERAGYWSSEISDTFRPTARHEVGDNELSLLSYLDALDGAYSHFDERYGPSDFFDRYRKHVYHAPFPGMALRAHRSLVSRLGLKGKKAALEDFDRTVREGLHFARRIGGGYGASNFICLMGLLQSCDDLEAGDLVSVFAYGSGCTGELYEAAVGPKATQRVRALDLDAHLDGREDLDIEQYEAIMHDREKKIDVHEYRNDLNLPTGAFRRMYRDRGYLILEGVAGFRRNYGWS